jgi:neopullulanase
MMKLPRRSVASLVFAGAIVVGGCGTYQFPAKPGADMAGHGGGGGSGGGGSGGSGGGNSDGGNGGNSDGGDGGSTPFMGLTPTGTSGTIAARSCLTTFTYSGTHTSVGVGGEWNNFTPAMTPMTNDGSGNWTASVMLAPGSYAYKLQVDGAATWIFDPATPLTKFVGGGENSVVEVDDCNLPQLTFKTLTKTADGTLHAEVTYTDGNSAAGLDAAKSGVMLDGAPIAATVDGNGVISVDATKLVKTKHRLIISAVDKAGHAAVDLHIPFWIEDRAFDFRDGLLYFTFTDRFRDGDATNDTLIPSVDFIANFQGGDWKGITQAINEGYFDSLGVRSIWVSPPNANPTHGEVGTGNHQYSGYHAYWPTAGTTPDPHFGTLADLKTLVSTAHAHGIRVIVDSVLNHVHTDHPYWQQHQNDNWFNPQSINNVSCLCHSGGNDDCGNWDSTNKNGYHGLYARETCWFEPYMPDLDYENFDAVTAMIDDALFWVREADVDGFRVDAVKHFLPIATTRLRVKLRQQFESAGAIHYLVGETFDEGGYTLINQFIGPNLLNGQFDFPVYAAVNCALATSSCTMNDLANGAAASDTSAATDGPGMSPFLGNHDVSRFLSTASGQLTSDPQGQAWTTPPPPPMMDPQTNAYYSLRLALTFVATSPGVPLVYYGDEYGQPGAGDPDNRRFMKWAGYSQFESDTLAVTQKLGAARKELDALKYGARTKLTSTNDQYVYARVYNGAGAVVVLNRDMANAATLTVPVPAGVSWPDGTVLTDRLGGAPLTVSGGNLAINVPAHTSQILAP